MKRPTPLRQLRQAAGVTLRTAAKELGTSFQHVARVERRELEDPELVRRLLDFLEEHSDPAEQDREDMVTPIALLCAEHHLNKLAALEAFRELKAGGDPEIWIALATKAMDRMERITRALEVRSREPS